jgi:hypothetical protein
MARLCLVLMLAGVFGIGGCGAGFSSEKTGADEPPEPSADVKAPLVAEGGGDASPVQVWMEPVVVYNRMFFFEELFPLTDAIAELLPSLSDHRISVMTSEDLRRIQAELRRGRIPDSDVVCSAPPVPAALFDYLHPDKGVVTTGVRCSETCELISIVYGPQTPSADGRLLRDELMRFAARLPREESVSEWVALLRSGAMTTAPPPGDSEGGLGIRYGRRAGTMKDGQYDLDVDDVVLRGPWRSPPSKEQLMPHVKAFHKCTKTTKRRNDHWKQPFQIEIDRAGRMTRCTSKYQHRLDPPSFACQCEVLKKVKWEHAAAPRQAEFSLRTHLEGESKRLRRASYSWLTTDFSATDGAVLLSGDIYEDEGISACMDAVGMDSVWTFDMVTEVDAGGKVNRLEVDWPEGFNAETRDCLKAVFRDARFNCPMTGAATVSGSVTIKVKRL